MNISALIAIPKNKYPRKNKKATERTLLGNNEIPGISTLINADVHYASL